MSCRARSRLSAPLRADSGAVVGSSDEDGGMVWAAGGPLTLGSTMVSILRSAPRTSINASCSTSVLPPLAKLSRAPTPAMASIQHTVPDLGDLAFWLSRIQVKRRRP